MCKFDAEIKSYKDEKIIIIIIYHVRTIANVAATCAIVTIMIAQTHFSSLRHAHVIGSEEF